MYEFQRKHSMFFMISMTVVFLLNLVAISVDEFTLISNVKRGLWRSSTIQNSPEFNGLEVMRGTTILTIILSFLSWIFSLLNLLRHSKFEQFKNYNYTNQFIFCTAITVMFNFISCMIFTVFIDAKYKALNSLYIIWISFGIAAATLILALLIKYSIGFGVGEKHV